MRSLFRVSIAVGWAREVVAISMADALGLGDLVMDADLRPRDDKNITLKAPILGVPSQKWEGNDGIWSTFEIRVGTPEQYFRVLPATSWQETWVLLSSAADVCSTSLGVSSNCQDSRGGAFSNSSSTWAQVPPAAGFALDYNTQLGEKGGGSYGFDTVGLGYTNGSSATAGATLTHQIVAQIDSQTFWFGILGMGFQPTNFTGFGDPQASFADTLYSNGTISSQSWSYTAGAYYRLKSVFGQMIFGGYDASRFTPNNLTFTMTGDNLRDIVLTVRSITATTPSGNTTLMDSPDFAFLDSGVPEIWLPKDVCQQFEKAFGLKLDSDSGYYLLDEATHSALRSSNPNITFTLANQKSGGATIDIVLPYASFDHNISAPLLPNRTSYYFPLRQADNDTQYTLGRTFLQEAYVTTHYNSRTFNVSQCVFSDSASADILAVPANLPSSATSSSSGSGSKSSPGSNTSSAHSGLSSGAIAGIVIGILAALAVLGLLAFLLLRRRRRRRLASSRASLSPPANVVEIGGRRIGEKPLKSGTAYEQQASAFRSEMQGQDSKVEIAGNPIMHPQELEAEVPMLAGTRDSERVSGPSDSSRGQARRP